MFSKTLLWSDVYADFDHLCTRKSRNIQRLFDYFSMSFHLIAFIFLWFKENLCILTSNLLYILPKIKSEKSTFVFKSPENKNQADKYYYQTNKWNSKNSACLQINFIKICQEIALKIFFWKKVVLYEIYRKKSKVTNTYVNGLYIYI